MITKPAMAFREWTGPLTADLVREPAKFGLGQVPARLLPDAATRAVCGFCSTGCGLKIHLKDGEAVNLTPDPDYPVNLGTACPKGWEALGVLDAPTGPGCRCCMAVRWTGTRRCASSATR